MSMTDGWPDPGKMSVAEYRLRVKELQANELPRVKPRCSEESDLQAELVRHVSGERPVERLLDGATIHSHPNEAAWNRARIRGMGVYVGITDLEFVARGGRSFFLEMKKKGGHLSKSQRDFRDWCIEMDVPWAMADSMVGALAQLRKWCLLRPERRGSQSTT